LYYASLDERRLPVLRGATLDGDDLMRREIIQRLTCEFRLEFETVERRYDVSFGARFAREIADLAALAADGLVTLSKEAVEVTDRGRLLVRTIAMVFDRHLRDAGERAGYSRVI
jgi:oxygen-independent coproporphyrinogen-3 oxidase